MARQEDKQLIYQIIKKYLDNLKKNNIPDIKEIIETGEQII